MNDAASGVTKARASLARAMEHWKQAGVDTCRRELNEAVDQIRSLRLTVAGLPAPDRQAVREEFARLQREIAAAERAMGVSAAFYRGLSARLGSSTAIYDAAGRIPPVRTEVENELHC